MNVRFKLSPEEVLAACREWIRRRSSEYDESSDKAFIHAIVQGKRLNVEGVEISFECAGREPYR